jgi:hypothetical protein
MDVADKLKKICILLTKDRFVPILKEMARTDVTPVMRESVAGQQTAHDLRYRNTAGFQQKVEVVGDKRPSATRCPCFFDKRSEPLDEITVVALVKKNGSSLNAPYDYVMQRVWSVDARFTGHEGILS